MYTSIPITRKNSPELSSSVSDLLQSTAQMLIIALGIIFFAFLFATVFWPEQIAINVWIVFPACLILLVISYWLLSKFYLLAIAMLHVSLLAAVSLPAYLFQQPEILFLYAVVPLVTVVTLGWRPGIVMQVVIMGLLFWANNGLIAQPISPALNLVNNSFRFTDKGSVAISLKRRENNTLPVCVEDTGTGITAAIFPIFSRDFGA